MYFSAANEQRKPPIASTIRKTLNLLEIAVNPIKLYNQSAGSRSMYIEMASANPMVMTKGTVKDVSPSFDNFDRLTYGCAPSIAGKVCRHSERWRRVCTGSKKRETVLSYRS